MNVYVPFIYDSEEKKEWEPEPLYIELIPPPPKKREEEETEDTERGVIIIQL